MTEWLNLTEDETVGWHHQLNGHEFKLAPGVGEGQRSLACYSPWGCKDLDTQLSNKTTMSSYIFNFWETLYYFPKWLHQFTIPPTVYKYPFFSSPSATHLFFLFGSSHYNWYKSILTVVLDFPCGSAVNKLPAVQETQEMQIWSLDREYPLEKEMTTCSSIPAHTVVLIFTFLVINNVEWFFIYLLDIFISSVDKCLFSSFAHF